MPKGGGEKPDVHQQMDKQNVCIRTKGPCPQSCSTHFHPQHSCEKANAITSYSLRSPLPSEASPHVGSAIDPHTGLKLLKYPSALVICLPNSFLSSSIPAHHSHLANSARPPPGSLLRSHHLCAPRFSHAYLYLCTLSITYKLRPPPPYPFRLSNRKANIVSYLIW